MHEKDLFHLMALTSITFLSHLIIYLVDTIKSEFLASCKMMGCLGTLMNHYMFEFFLPLFSLLQVLFKQIDSLDTEHSPFLAWEAVCDVLYNDAHNMVPNSQNERCSYPALLSYLVPSGSFLVHWHQNQLHHQLLAGWDQLTSCTHGK